jgi:hypothetical protein
MRGAAPEGQNPGRVLKSWQRWYGRRMEFLEADSVSAAYVRVSRTSPSRVQFSIVLPHPPTPFFVAGDEVFSVEDGDSTAIPRRVGIVVDAVTWPAMPWDPVAGAVTVNVNELEAREIDDLRSPGMLLNRAAVVKPEVQNWLRLLGTTPGKDDALGSTLRGVVKMLWPAHPVRSPNLARRRVNDILGACTSVAADLCENGEHVAVVAIDGASAAILADRLWEEHGMIARWRGADPSTTLLPMVKATAGRVRDLSFSGDGLAKRYPGHVSAAAMFYREALGLLERVRSLDPVALRAMWLVLEPDIELLTVADAVSHAATPGEGTTIVPCEAGITVADVLAASKVNLKTLVLTRTPVPPFPSASIPEGAWLAVHVRRRERSMGTDLAKQDAALDGVKGSPRSSNGSGEDHAIENDGIRSPSPQPSPSMPSSNPPAPQPPRFPNDAIWEDVECEWPILEREVTIAMQNPRGIDPAKGIALSYLLQLGPAPCAEDIARASFLHSPAWFSSALRDLEREKLVVRNGNSWGIPGGSKEAARRWLRDANDTRTVDKVARTCLLTGMLLPDGILPAKEVASGGSSSTPPPVVPAADLRHLGIHGTSTASDVPIRVTVVRERHVAAAVVVQWRLSGRVLHPTVAWKGGGKLGQAFDDAAWCMSRSGQLPPCMMPRPARSTHLIETTVLATRTDPRPGGSEVVPPAAVTGHVSKMVDGAGDGAILAFLPPDDDVLGPALRAAIDTAAARDVEQEKAPARLLVRVVEGSEIGIAISPNQVAIATPPRSLPATIPVLVATKERALAAASVSGVYPGRVVSACVAAPAGTSDGLRRLVQVLVTHLPALVQKLLTPGRADMTLLANLVKWAEVVADTLASMSSAGVRAPEIALDAARKFAAKKSIDPLVRKPDAAPLRATFKSWEAKVGILLPPLTKADLDD